MHSFASLNGITLNFWFFLSSTARAVAIMIASRISARAQKILSTTLGEAGNAGARIHGGRKRFRGGGPEIYSPQRNISREHGSSVESIVAYL